VWHVMYVSGIEVSRIRVMYMYVSGIEVSRIRVMYMYVSGIEVSRMCGMLCMLVVLRSDSTDLNTTNIHNMPHILLTSIPLTYIYMTRILLTSIPLTYVYMTRILLTSIPLTYITCHTLYRSEERRVVLRSVECVSCIRMLVVSILSLFLQYTDLIFELF
jgi:hypothetical protein